MTLFTLLFHCAGAGAAVAYVIVGGNGLTFSPQTIDINAGDTVTFLNFGGLHNVDADDGSFRCAQGCDGDGHGGSGNPSGQLWSVSIDFPNAGTIGYFCETHGAPGSGMFGTIHVLGTPPVATVTPAPTGGMWFDVVLVAALTAAAALRMRRARCTNETDSLVKKEPALRNPRSYLKKT